MTEGSITLHELRSQPDAWRAVADRVTSAPAHPDIDLAGFEEVLFLGSGSSHYIAAALGEASERELGVRARAIPSCEILLDLPRVLPESAGRVAVIVSRSGESTEALRACNSLRDANVPVIALTCAPEGSLAKRSDHVLAVPEGREDGLAMLRSFTSMLLAFKLFLARSARTSAPPIGTLAAVADRILAEDHDQIRDLAHRKPFDRFVFLASGPGYPMAREAALKMQEMAIVTSEAYQSLEYRHGPKSTADPSTLVVLFARDRRRELEVDLLSDLRDYGVQTMVVAEDPAGFGSEADVMVTLASGTDEDTRIVLPLLASQLLAYETAMRRGENPDVSRNLTQVVRL